MAKALSVDLRERVVVAVAGGVSRHRAAVHFGVSPASAVRWCKQWQEQGDLTPKRQGGDRRSHHIEVHAGFLLDRIAEEPDATLEELRQALAEAKGRGFGIGTVWRFFDRHEITLKKSRRMPPSRNVRTS
jgi:transposase